MTKEQLEEELKLRVDGAAELRDHLRSCNAEKFQLKKTIKDLERQLEYMNRSTEEREKELNSMAGDMLPPHLG